MSTAGRRRGRAGSLVATIGAVAVLLPGLLLTLATPAAAHSRLETTSPTAGATLDAPPAEIVLTFNESVSARYSRVAVTGPGAISVTRGAVSVDGATVRQPLAASAAGAYTVSYQVVSQDGHPVGGTFTFTVTRSSPTASPSVAATTASASPSPTGAAVLASSPTASPAAEDTDNDGGGHWVTVTVVVIVALLAVGAVLAVVRRRRSGAR
ncbi:copper resistance CopC family protein [Frankia sp. AgB32]|uniref:copper resistance CopC family protein n=1 Tax=Frankia sp. AgB32 TaxID=631119 RepID=UPI00200D0F9B|nr:copper resistance CopC family protein [Frankia sp. AgB32]MCK9896440.1 copper resistance protein CopC [Frankia sp. AgB32]